MSTRHGIRNKKGRNIAATSINRIIKNAIYTGVIHNGDFRSEVIPELQIIDQETFDRAQVIMAGVSGTTVMYRSIPKADPCWWEKSTVGIVAVG